MTDDYEKRAAAYLGVIKRFPVLDEYEFWRPRLDEYYFRPASFMSFAPMRVSLAGSIDLRQWDGYAVVGDCELQDWEDRANEEDCWRDWWRADWIQPEPGQ